jgi:hypothetical protein
MLKHQVELHTYRVTCILKHRVELHTSTVICILQLRVELYGSTVMYTETELRKTAKVDKNR